MRTKRERGVTVIAIISMFLLIGCKDKSKDERENQDCIYLKSKVHDLVQMSKNEEALQTMDSISVCDSTSRWYIEHRGMILAKLGRYADAYGYLSQLITAGNTSPATYYWAGKCSEILKDTINSIKYYSLVPSGDSLYPLALNNLGEIHRAQRKFDLALSEFRTAISIVPNFTFAYNNLAHTYSLKGESDSAYLYFSLGLNISKQDYLYYGRAVVNYKKGEYVKAISDFDSAIVVNPKNDLAYLYRGYSYFAIEKSEMMCQDLAAAMQLGNQEALRVYQSKCSNIKI